METLQEKIDRKRRERDARIATQKAINERVVKTATEGWYMEDWQAAIEANEFLKGGH